jgi:hypothetical protein
MTLTVPCDSKLEIIIEKLPLTGEVRLCLNGLVGDEPGEAEKALRPVDQSAAARLHQITPDPPSPITPWCSSPRRDQATPLNPGWSTAADTMTREALRRDWWRARPEPPSGSVGGAA